MDNDNLNLIMPDPQPTRADAVKNRALILGVAARLFTEQGVGAISMTMIAEAAGVGKGTLYRHFENKTDLCQALLDHNQRELQAATFQRLRGDDTPLDKLRWFLIAVYDYVEQNAELLYADSSSAPMLEHRAHGWWRLTIHGLLEQIAPCGDLDFMTDVLYLLVDVRSHHFLHAARGYDVNQVRQGLLTTLDKLLG
jgi:AcrR family transcriptional regulator